jgi:hypothetical protein
MPPLYTQMTPFSAEATHLPLPTPQTPRKFQVLLLNDQEMQCGPFRYKVWGDE